jgi:hypothetical protein
MCIEIDSLSRLHRHDRKAKPGNVCHRVDFELVGDLRSGRFNCVIDITAASTCSVRALSRLRAVVNQAGAERLCENDSVSLRPHCFCLMFLVSMSLSRHNQT